MLVFQVPKDSKTLLVNDVENLLVRFGFLLFLGLFVSLFERVWLLALTKLKTEIVKFPSLIL